MPILDTGFGGGKKYLNYTNIKPYSSPSTAHDLPELFVLQIPGLRKLACQESSSTLLRRARASKHPCDKVKSRYNFFYYKAHCYDISLSLWFLVLVGKGLRWIYIQVGNTHFLGTTLSKCSPFYLAPQHYNLLS